MSPIPIHVLSGFLGSGKTTLLNRLLRNPAFSSTAVIVNEIGEIGLDHFLIQRSSDNVVLLESGCLCCTIVNSLHETLAHLDFQRVRGEIPAFERVIIETTGLAEPGPILNTLLGHPAVTPSYRLERLVVTVDAQNAPSRIRVQPEIAKQIALADSVVITKLDLVDDGGDVMALLDKLNSTAERFDARSSDASTHAFRSSAHRHLPAEPTIRFSQRAGSPGGRHGEHIRAHTLVLESAPSWAGIAAWWQIVRDSFGDRMLRCKGLIEIADGGDVVFIQAVQRVFHKPERLDGWPDADHRSRLVCITSGIDESELLRTLPAFALPAGTPPGMTLADLDSNGRAT
jgi:G3E family GTPase